METNIETVKKAIDLMAEATERILKDEQTIKNLKLIIEERNKRIEFLYNQVQELIIQHDEEKNKVIS